MSTHVTLYQLPVHLAEVQTRLYHSVQGECRCISPTHTLAQYVHVKMHTIQHAKLLKSRPAGIASCTYSCIFGPAGSDFEM